MDNVQKVQIVKGRDEKIANVLALAISVAVIYYSFVPGAAEHHIEQVTDKLSKLRAKLDEWHSINDTFRAIWEAQPADFGEPPK